VQDFFLVKAEGDENQDEVSIKWGSASEYSFGGGLCAKEIDIEFERGRSDG
jgi:hypothetical protein